MRIVISVLTILLLPFFIKEEKVNDEEILRTGFYCNTDFNYCLQYPAYLENVMVENELYQGITLKSAEDDVILRVYGSRSAKRKDIYDLYESVIEENIDSLPVSQVFYQIITERYCEASYKSTQYHYFDKVFHQGSKMVGMRIRVPVEASEKIDQIRSDIDLKLNVALL